MQSFFSKTCNSQQLFLKVFGTISLGALVASIPAAAQEQDKEVDIHFFPGNLVVSRSVYDDNANNVKVGAMLPPNCANTVGPCAPATNNGKYPFVFNNVIPDPSFGVTAKVYLDQITPFGFVLDSLEVPNSSLRKVRTESDQLVTSFSSKSEIALNLSTDG